MYGPHLSGEGAAFLYSLQALSNIYPDELWIVVGDFNMLTSLGEKKGGITRANLDMEALSEAINNLRLMDKETINGIHTLKNRIRGIHQIASHLDRFLISEQLISNGIFIEATILPCMGSDHWPVRLEVDLKVRSKNRPFRFEAFWLRYLDILKKMEEWWTQSTQQGHNRTHTFQLKLKELKKRLKNWKKEEFWHILRNQMELNQRMADIQQKMINGGRIEEMV